MASKITKKSGGGPPYPPGGTPPALLAHSSPLYGSATRLAPCVNDETKFRTPRFQILHTGLE